MKLEAAHRVLFVTVDIEGIIYPCLEADIALVEKDNYRISAVMSQNVFTQLLDKCPIAFEKLRVSDIASGSRERHYYTEIEDISVTCEVPMPPTILCVDCNRTYYDDESVHEWTAAGEFQLPYGHRLCKPCGELRRNISKHTANE